ncbi:MAG: hypothetical protein OSA88_12130, partial [Acidimicrobiales bacterium]|nr:hypothetical protein [Acidimicrobiales bacterium]
MSVIQTSKFFTVLAGSIVLVLIAAGCSIGSTDSADSADSTTTLPTVTTSAATSSSSADAEQPSSTTGVVQSAAERYGSATTLVPILTNADTITTAGLGPVRIGQLLEKAQSEAGVELIAASTGSEA